MLALAEETTQRELGPRRQLWQEAVPVEGDKPNSAQNTFTVTAENDTAQELPAVDVGEKVHLLARIQSRLAVMLEDRDKEREQLCALLYHLPRWIESVFTNIMPDAAIVILVLASFVILNAISLVYLLLAAFMLYAPKMLRLRPTRPWGDSDSDEYHAQMTEWLAMSIEHKSFILVYFCVFLIFASQLRASYALAMAYLDAKTNPLALPAGLPADAPVIWSELTLEARQEWTALDWARYFSYRHSLECFLVLTFAAGTGPRDVVHGGYLFFSLVFLRLRDRCDPASRMSSPHKQRRAGQGGRAQPSPMRDT
ncbi:hypothetical protein CYMTET_35192 [Cymbomonas tetramitiformis]|uniref:Uncharacterized protein n=1 Tax=Cymbomonas tetramitiformis TaxID=36881 RepID=A0AAE0KPE8_9CHLO|nr:hypothetical protein CYMTET_35192 [Cymbomonas tetramitiformis]